MSAIDWKTLRKDATTVLEGDFLAVIERASAGQSQNGNPMVKALVKITAGPYAGRTIPANFTLTDKSMGLFFQNMTQLGLDEAFFDSISGQGMEPVAAALTGLSVEIKVDKRQWNGQDRENISAWKRIGAGGLPVASGLPAATSLPSAAATLPTAPAVTVSAPPVAPGEDGGDPF